MGLFKYCVLLCDFFAVSVLPHIFTNRTKISVLYTQEIPCVLKLLPPFAQWWSRANRGSSSCWREEGLPLCISEGSNVSFPAVVPCRWSRRPWGRASSTGSRTPRAAPCPSAVWRPGDSSTRAASTTTTRRGCAWPCPAHRLLLPWELESTALEWSIPAPHNTLLVNAHVPIAFCTASQRTETFH